MGTEQGLSLLMLPSLFVQHVYLRVWVGPLLKWGSCDLSDKVGLWVTVGGQPGFWDQRKDGTSRLGSRVHVVPLATANPVLAWVS